MARQHAQSQPTWAAIKAKLASLDRLALIGLIQDLYAADRDNQVFLHARFGLGEDVLKPYKEALDRWLWPDVLRNQDTSVAKAKQTISSYRKAVGAPAGLAELMVYYCETAAGFSSDIGLQDEDFFDALVRMFEQALKMKAAIVGNDMPMSWQHGYILSASGDRQAGVVGCWTWLLKVADACRRPAWTSSPTKVAQN
jgi:hypothetical protein